MMPWPKGQSTEHLRVWDKEQEEYVRQNYDGEGSKLSNVLPFSSSAIRNKAKRLGVINNQHFHNVIKTGFPKLTEFELGYVAAFLDGEGSITHSATATTKTSHRIQIANSNQEVIFWLRDLLRVGKVRIREPRKHQHLCSYIFYIERQGDVWGFLEMIAPYLKIKQFKANQVLTLLKERYEKCIVSA